MSLRIQQRLHVTFGCYATQDIKGLVETSPGVRSCMVEYDQRQLPLRKLLDILLKTEQQLPKVGYCTSCALRMQIVCCPHMYRMALTVPSSNSILMHHAMEKGMEKTQIPRLSGLPMHSEPLSKTPWTVSLLSLHRAALLECSESQRTAQAFTPQQMPASLQFLSMRHLNTICYIVMSCLDCSSAGWGCDIAS